MEPYTYDQVPHIKRSTAPGRALSREEVIAAASWFSALVKACLARL